MLLTHRHEFLAFQKLGSLYVILNFSNKYHKVIRSSRHLQPDWPEQDSRCLPWSGHVTFSLPVPSRPAYLIYKNLSAHQVTRHNPQAALVTAYLESLVSHYEASCGMWLISSQWAMRICGTKVEFRSGKHGWRTAYISPVPECFQQNSYFLKPAPVSEIWIRSVCAPGSCSTLEGCCYSKVTSTWLCARWDLYLRLFGKGSQAELV